MNKIQFEPKISFGHIGQAILIVVGLTAGYYQFKADAVAMANASEKARNAMNTQIEIIRIGMTAQIDKANNRIDTEGALTNQRLLTISETLKQLRADLREARNSGGPQK